MTAWLLNCRARRLEYLRVRRAAVLRARKLRDAQREAHARLGDRALIPGCGKSRYLYRP